MLGIECECEKIRVRKTQHIGINGLYVKWGVNAGTETYFTNIVRPWYESTQQDWTFTLYCNQLPPWWNGNRAFFKAEVHHAASKLPGRFALEQLILPSTSFRHLGVLFSPGYICSLLACKQQIVTIHDGFAWHYPAEIGWLRSLYWRTFIPLSTKVAARVVAVSDSTANDVSQFCKVRRSKIKVIYEAGGHLEAVHPSREVLERLELRPHQYFHCVGFFKEIKNPWRILEAYKRYVGTTPANERKKLVLVGHAGGKSGQRILAAARSMPGVIIAGRISDEELAAIYKVSAGLVFPSLYEGFGIPILEAQSFGCPVVTSNISSMPEVAGDGALVVDPFSVEDISRAICDLGRAAPTGLGRVGTKNLERFSWQKASDETLTLIKQVALEG